MTTTEILKGRLQAKPGVIGASVVTRSGRYFDFLNPTPEMVDVEDIAWGLANTCRFGGQSLAFYSVAQHCVLASWLAPLEFRFQALMHDAAEAYIGDMVGPLKQLCPDFKAIEHRVEKVIFDKFGLPLPMPPVIKHVDLRMLRTEQRDLTAGAGDSWNGLDAYEPMDSRINPWAPERAAAEWLSEFSALGGHTREAFQTA